MECSLKKRKGGLCVRMCKKAEGQGCPLLDIAKLSQVELGAS